MELYHYFIKCPEGSLLIETVANLAFTSQILYFFDIKKQLPTVISGQKSSSFFMDWQV